MYLELTDEQRAVREVARKFAEEYIVPVARENDVNERFPGDIIEKMGALGLLGGPVPVEYGGAGLDHISQALVTEEIDLDGFVETDGVLDLQFCVGRRCASGDCVAA